MKYISTRDPNEQMGFKEAVIKGLAKNKGLFVPDQIPELPASFINNIENLTKDEIGITVLQSFVNKEIEQDRFEQIVSETLNFPFPLVEVKPNIYSLELFHGPTQAFKDVGSRFMSRCLSQFLSKGQTTTVLVATSGDTGSAVANGFHGVEGVDVIILFPKAKVSAYQEHQMSSLGGNIKAVEVDGTFDDCQAMVKQAFSDVELNKKHALSSANSINVARMLPQMVYYFLAYQQMRQAGKDELVVAVPSGNLGNLTAGLIAKKMGLPIKRFVSAMNVNDTFYQYMKTGVYEPKPSKLTYSNAMDVGDPSNLERINYLYNDDRSSIEKDVHVYRLEDGQTLKQMVDVYHKSGYMLDPHGAVAMHCLEQDLKEHETGVFLETASPIKFESVVKKAIPAFEIPVVDLSQCKKIKINNNYDEFLALF